MGLLKNGYKFNSVKRKLSYNKPIGDLGEILGCLWVLLFRIKHVDFIIERKEDA